jgi:hypothetical protein
MRNWMVSNVSLDGLGEDLLLSFIGKECQWLTRN